MEILPVILFAYIGSIVSKVILVNFARDDILSLFKTETDLRIRKLIIIPLIYSLRAIEASKNLRFKQLRSLTIIIELLGITSFSLLSIFFIRSLLSSQSSFEILFILLFHSGVSASMLYLSIFDLLNLKLPARFTKIFLLSVIFTSIIIGLVRYFSSYFSNELLLREINLGNFNNLLAGIIMAIITFTLIKIFKEKMLSEADFDFMIAFGLILGLPLTLLAFTSALSLATLLALGYALITRKFKGLLVPIVPMLLLGYIFTMAFRSELSLLI
jgi:hypothetical protein